MPLSRITNPFLNVSGAVNANIASPSANTIAFTTAATERMRIDSAGNVGIGTTAPAYKLDVVGTINVPADSSYTLGAGADRYIKYRSGNSDILYSFSAGNFYKQDIASSYHAWFTGNNERMRINAFGIGLGGGAPSSGTGVTFPASQSASSDANTLDDYEEGTFTPNLVNNGTSSTFSAKDGWYRKIGSVVHYWVRFDGGNSGTAGTALQIVNLPFTFLSGTAAAQVGGVFSSNNAGVPTGSVNPQGNTNYAYIYYGGALQTAQATYLSAMITGMTTA